MKALNVRLFLLTLLASPILAPAYAAETPETTAPQLAIREFARCLQEANGGAAPDLRGLRERYGFGTADLLLPYLAFYPGQWPSLSSRLEPQARARWSTRWNAIEAALAERLASAVSPIQDPGQLFQAALQACGENDVFCAALVTQNVLRTLGRHWRSEAAAADWFKARPDFWNAQGPGIQARLFSLRTDGQGDRWGEWYHFFGVLSFAIREFALHGDLSETALAAAMNSRLNRWIAGAPENPEKARLDRDTVQVARSFLTAEPTPTAPAPASCRSRAAYVATP